MVTLLFELSGEHPSLPQAELECIGEVVEWNTQVAIAECSSVEETGRVSLSHTVMAYLGGCDATLPALGDLLASLDITARGTFSARVKKTQGAVMPASKEFLERFIGDRIKGSVDLSYPDEEYRLIVSGSHCYFGRVLAHLDRGSYEYRNPLRRPFFHPGVMLPRMARAMVNLSLIQRGELLIDPFCGTGGILQEALMVGARIAGADVDRSMVEGCRRNLLHPDVVVADAAHMPFLSGTVDAVVADFPYGQSVGIHSKSVDHLYAESLGEVYRILKHGRRAVIVTHRDIRNRSGLFRLLQFHETRIHKSLTRRIMVLEKR